MIEAVAAMRAAIDQGVPGVLGIHLEGPFLNPERKGAHDPALMRPVGPADVALLTSRGPRQDSRHAGPGDRAACRHPDADRRGVIVSAGHTAATVETIAEARRPGLLASPISLTPCRRLPAVLQVRSARRSPIPRHGAA